MKPQRALTLLVTVLALVAGACRPEPEAEEAACCSADAALAAEPASLPDSSLYLLDSEWTDQTGATRHLGDFKNEVVVTAMIFTHCEYACPRIIADLQRLEELIPEGRRSEVRFLLVSMDTERDTPAVLAAYARTRGLDSNRWTLLHGEAFAVRGFAATLGVRYKRDVYGNFAHSNLITVLHRDGRIAHQLEGLNGDVAPSAEAVMGCLPKS